MKFRDGLHDLQTGLILLVVFVFMMVREYWAVWWVLPGYVVLCGAITGVYVLVRTRVSRPRIGTMRPLPTRRQRTRTGAAVLAVFVILQAILILLQMIGVLRPDFERLFVGAIVSLLVFVPMALIAWFHDFTRGYFHAFLVGISAGALIMLDSPYPFLIAALLILVVGGVVFVRFLKEFPLPDENDVPEGSPAVEADPAEWGGNDVR